MNAIAWGSIAAIVGLLGTVVKIITDYNKVKARVEALEKEDKDIRIDLTKDIQRIEDIQNAEINRLREDFKKEQEYTHQSFVHLTKEQQTTADILKEVSITLKTFEQSIDQRLSSLERKIDSITTLKIVDK